MISQSAARQVDEDLAGPNFLVAPLVLVCAAMLVPAAHFEVNDSQFLATNGDDGKGRGNSGCSQTPHQPASCRLV